MSAVGTMLWWTGNALVLVLVVPAVALLAGRILRALAVVEGAARDVRSSLAAVAADAPQAIETMTDIALGVERMPQPAIQ